MHHRAIGLSNAKYSFKYQTSFLLHEMSSHFELEPNQRPDMKRKIVVVGDGAPCLLFGFDLRRNLTPCKS